MDNPNFIEIPREGEIEYDINLVLLCYCELRPFNLCDPQECLPHYVVLYFVNNKNLEFLFETKSEAVEFRKKILGKK